MKPFLAALALTLLGGAAHAAVLVVAAGPNAQERLQTALIDAKPGDNRGASARAASP